MTEIEAAKKLLERAIKTGDQELINIANDLLAKYDDIEKPKRGRKKKVNLVAPPIESKASVVLAKSGAVRWTGNQWTDTGELGELGNEAKKTPKIKLQPRNREKFKKVSVTCTSCNKNMEVNPAYITSKDSYKCDRCLSKAVGR